MNNKTLIEKLKFILEGETTGGEGNKKFYGNYKTYRKVKKEQEDRKKVAEIEARVKADREQADQAAEKEANATWRIGSSEAIAKIKQLRADRAKDKK